MDAPRWWCPLCQRTRAVSAGRGVTWKEPAGLPPALSLLCSSSGVAGSEPTHRPGLWDLPRGGARGQRQAEAGPGRTGPLPSRGKKPAADFVEGGSSGGWVCSSELTLAEWGLPNPKPSAWPLTRMPGPPRPCPRPYPTPGEGARHPLPARKGVRRGEGRTPGLRRDRGRGQKATSRDERRRKAGSTLGLGTLLEPRSVLAPPPHGTWALVLALFV